MGMLVHYSAGPYVVFLAVHYMLVVLPKRSAKWKELALIAVSCGALLGTFMVFHVLHINYGWLHPHFLRGRVYQNLLTAFASPVVVAAYVLGSVLLALHLAHGLAAAAASLGWRAPSATSRRLALAFGAAIGVGFAAAPLAMGLGVLR